MRTATSRASLSLCSLLLTLGFASLPIISSAGEVKSKHKGHHHPPKETVCHFPFPFKHHSRPELISVDPRFVPFLVKVHNDAVCEDDDSDCCFGGHRARSQCTDFDTDVKNCGACGNVCAEGDTCMDGECKPMQVPASCLPSSSLSVLIQPPAVTAYVPLGSWTESGTGVKVVPLEPAPGASTTVATAKPVNSCSSNGATGTTVCTGNANDVYVIHGTTLGSTPTAGATGTQNFSGGLCSTCGVVSDAGSGLSWIAEGMTLGSGVSGALQFFNPATSVFGPPISLAGEQTSEDISLDPIRQLILSAAESGQFQIADLLSGTVYNYVSAPVKDAAGARLTLDSTAEDCSTGIALAPNEAFETSLTQSIFFVNLSGVTVTPPVSPGMPGTWTGPTNVRDFGSDFANLQFGPAAVAVAPGSHLAVVSGEFGPATGFAAIQLPASIAPAATPDAVDWASANMPTDPSGTAWQMGLDPHTVTAYVSPSTGRAIGVMSNVSRTFLALVDLQKLLSAPRTAGTHKVDPTVDLVASGIVTFVAE